VPKPQNKAELEKNVMAILMDDDVKIEKQHPDSRKALNIDDLIPFADHPFKLYEGERLDDMVRSVGKNGVIVPVIVRPMPDGDEGTYEILSGHNRVNAAKLAGLTEVPVIIKKDLTDNEAELIVTETNLMQRSFIDLLHSERAVALKRHMDAISKQGKRNDLLDEIKILSNPHEIKENGTCILLDDKLKSSAKLGVQYGLSQSSVRAI
jgi:ParB family chromosome partitioning protein